jgi:uncharacterized protein involved in exopolysaccharide biosynthesis
MAPVEFDTPASAEPRRSFISRNLGLIIIISLLVTFWMLLYTFTMYRPNYKAEATVIIKDSAITNRYVEPEQYYAMQTTTSTSSNPVLNTMGILKAQPISVALWNYFSAQHPEELKKLKIKTQKEWDAYYQDGSGFIKAKNQQGTDLISIQFAWSSPIVAREALGVVVKAFQDTSRDLNKEEQVSRTKFLSRQMMAVQAQVEAIRTQKSEYESQNATVNIRRESDDLAGTRMELENKLSQLQAQIQGKEHMAQRYQEMLNMSPEAALHAASLGQDSTMSRLQDELYRLQQQASLMSSSLTDNNPKVREIYAQIDQVKTSIEIQKSRIMGPFSQKEYNDDIVSDGTRNTMINEMLKAQGDIRDLQAQAAITRQRLEKINSNIRQFPGTAEGLANMEQQEASLSTALDHLRQRVMEGQMKEAQTLSNVFVVDAPRLPDHASFPNKNHLVVLSLVLGLASGFAAAFLKEQLFSTPGYSAFPGQIDEADLTENAEDLSAAEAVRAYNGQWRPNAATNFAVPTAASLRRNPLTADRAEGGGGPVAVGSLFDTLVPITGWASLRKSKPQGEIRRDLTGPLPTTAATPQAVALAMAQTSANTTNRLADADLLPPDSSEEIFPTLVQQENLSQSFTPAQGFPVMHAAPAPTSVNGKEPMSVEILPPVSSPMQPSESLKAEESATAFYEAQAKAMPLPRKRGRAVPAFLLDSNTLDVESSYAAPEAPYELVSKKQRLQAEDNLFQDMSPLLPTPPAPNYPPMPQFVPPEFLNKRKKSLFGGLFSGPKHREPELMLGGLPSSRR